MAGRSSVPKNRKHGQPPVPSGLRRRQPTSNCCRANRRRLTILLLSGKRQPPSVECQPPSMNRILPPINIGRPYGGCGGGGGIFRQGKFGGGDFRFSDWCQVPGFFLKNLCAIRAISCSLGRQLTFFFCTEVLVPVYCRSGSVFMLVHILCIFLVSCASRQTILCASQRICLCIRTVSQGLWFRNCTQSTKIWGHRNTPHPNVPPTPVVTKQKNHLVPEDSPVQW